MSRCLPARACGAGATGTANRPFWGRKSAKATVLQGGDFSTTYYYEVNFSTTYYRKLKGRGNLLLVSNTKLNREGILVRLTITK